MSEKGPHIIKQLLDSLTERVEAFLSKYAIHGACILTGYCFLALYYCKAIRFCHERVSVNTVNNAQVKLYCAHDG